ncbi:MAG: methylated-DNA--[protein]-cysteine S-methyltransferase [Dehalococcoidia bacterium]|nr:methylated-DNA--[protein]-cysteine S-methyltransferase [Dehalococcoidia bacterium]
MPPRPPEDFTLDRFATPIGAMLIVSDRDGFVRATDWDDHEERMHTILRRQYGAGGVRLVDGAASTVVRDALRAYFDGATDALDAVPVRTAGTPFQRVVWDALRAIPAGATRSYGELAQSIGRPSAVRAVGLANGANPTGVIVPCHRVIGADRTLTGYGGGLDRKGWLLRHEGAAFIDAGRGRDG